MEQNSSAFEGGIIAYFARNPVAANLMMVFIIVVGIASYFTLQRQMFPSFERNFINIAATYRGASPQEIEEGILIKIEEALKDVTEIDKIITTAQRGSGRVSIQVDSDYELSDVLDKVKVRVDGIATFPAGMEPVTVSQAEFTQRVINMVLAADLPLSQLKPVAMKIEDELLQLGNISLVQAELPADEIAIEIKPEVLRKYNLTLSDVSNAIRRYSANFSAGQLNTDAGIVAVRVENQFYSGEEFRQIPIKIGANGARVLLGDLAEIKDDFIEGERYFKYNGKNAISISVNATANQNMVPMAETVKRFIDKRNQTLPPEMRLETLVDMTYYLNARLDMMLNNMLQGIFLVALMLTLFLRFKLAFWVMVGLPVCFLGAMMMMPLLGVSINIVSLFAFIMVLGIVVDDAIVIGESAYTEMEKSGHSINSVIRGAKRVATPATFGVLTTIAVFAPFAMSSGPQSSLFFNISAVVILCLVFSLIESKLILPAHLAHAYFKPVKKDSWRERFNARFFAFVNGPYRRFVHKCTEWRYTVLASFIGLLILAIGLMAANHVRFIFLPKVPHDFPTVILEMNDNVSDQQTLDALKAIEGMIKTVDAQTQQSDGQTMIRDMLVFNQGRTRGRIVVPLVDENLRPYDAFELSRRWRENMPEIAGLKSLEIQDDPNGGANGEGEFGYLLYGPDSATLNAAGRQFIAMLQQEKGLFDISSTIDPSSREMRMSLKPVAYDLGLNLAGVASQVGASFYGGEAQRVIRDGEEVRVMVRYPKLTREALASLNYTVITTPAGKEVMLGDVVEFTEQPGISTIRREAGYRSVYVWGAIDEEVTDTETVKKRVKEDLMPQLFKQFPSVKSELGGALEDQQEQKAEQIRFFITGMLVVYILLAIPLKSYSQPLIVMSVIPFSLTGAIAGHYLIGLDLSLMSTYGLIAAAGVVVNDSLVMTDFVQQMRKQGHSIQEAVVEAGCARFRAITLTSITTFMGVLPIMFETSLQAQFVIPMAVSLGFAVLYATLVTLLLVPCLYLILQDIRTPFSYIKRKLSSKHPHSVSTS